ncbi:PDZ domain-containing protein [Spirosoma sp. HMF4905]|uniref:Tricorn protease homolog n=1 Tax=Spirosoma arboris TaxID=2682092 RepID=A0A7K1SHV6_9BACT|nr:S41 family peptidase [Spirosoma arboris]MVM33355.1 PDZ domain-containing protein [Spirosoma arboris]
MHTLSTRLLLRCLLLAAISLPSLGQTQSATPTPRFAYAEPSLSPDGAEVAFVSGGDIWTVPTAGGEARLLVSHPDNESRPLYSPDGKYLAFASSRTGNGDIYLLTLETGTIKRLTYDDGSEVLNAWSRDSKMVYFQSTSRDISGMNDIYRVAITGGTPMPVTADRYANEFYSAPSPDGKTLAFSARGIASNQWWRKGRSHLDEAEIWLYHLDTKKAETAYEQVTQSGAKELWPMWSQDGKTIYYVSDRNKIQNLWSQPISGKPTMLTTFTSGRVVWPSIGYDGKTIVFERDFGLWKYDIASRQATPISVRLRGVAASPAVEHLKQASQFRELALSPDGKKVAFTVHGEVFAASAKDGGDATRISHTAANESQPVWTSNSRGLVYLSSRDGVAHLYRYDFGTRDETRLTNDLTDDSSPVFSPDGKLLAFIRNGQELRVLDIATKKEKLLKKGFLGRPPFASSGSIVWSPDGKWIAFASFGAKTFRNISVVPAAGGESKPISFLANTFGGNLSWSPDGKYILFSTTQRTETAQVARIDLVLRSPKFREDQFRDLFNEEIPKTLKPATAPTTTAKTASRDTTARADTADKSDKGGATKIVFEDIRQRLSLLPVGVDVDAQSISKDGKTLLLTATVAGQQNLYTYSLDELGREQSVARQLTSTPGNKSGVQFSSDGKEIFYLEQGRIQSIALDRREPKPLSISTEMDVDFSEEKIQVFRQAWDIQSKGFYDSTFHGADWKAIRAEYEPLAAGARTPDELRRLISLMLGELNASHSGISAPAGSVQTTTGRIGLRFDRTEYESTGRLRITEVIALSPADIAGTIKVGDYLLGVDDTKINAGTNLDQLLENQINHRISLMIASSATAPPHEVVIRPVNLATEKVLLYKQWVQQQRDYVNKASDGRLGYVHLFDMSAESLAQLNIDLDADNHAREGVVVDVRNNNGGFVNAYALDVFTRKGYMTMTPRGLPSAPARTQLGQRALERPTILVTNQHSLSDAEDFTEGYRTLKLGKVVGEPTGGWIIYTSAAQLIDGSNLRLPFIKITDNTGKNMELAPRPVDIEVARPIGESYTNKNVQLDRAVTELLKELNEAKASKLSTGK